MGKKKSVSRKVIRLCDWKMHTDKYHGGILQAESWKAPSVGNQEILWPNKIFREKNMCHILTKDNTHTLDCFVASQKECASITTGGLEPKM